MTRTSDPFWKTATDARQYDEFARTRFARVYPVIADQILERTGITRGTCLDVGSGPGLLAIAVALLSDLHVTALDNSPEMLALARRNIRDRCMEEMVVPAIGDVHAIPAADASFDLVISRGSFHSWNRLPAAFREIYRVLKPWGMAYIGGGYGSPKVAPSEMRKLIEAAGISDYRIIHDDSGFWILIKKSAGQNEQNSPAPGMRTGREGFPVFHNGFFFPE
jgi:ubiquinone/menaquinone biosynthesis C-methylase UbiE